MQVERDGKEYDVALLMFLINGSIFLELINITNFVNYLNPIIVLGILIVTTIISVTYGYNTFTGVLGGIIGIVAFALGLLITLF